MPIYEFYCADCHRVYSFLSKTVNTTKRPACPRCGRPKLERKVSRFAVGRRRTQTEEAPAGSEGGENLPPGFDEAKLEQAMGQLAGEAEGADEDDPRQMARMMRKLYDSTGLKLGRGMEEAMRRLEAGEDPETIEEELGDVLEGEEPLLGEGEGGLRGLSRKLKPPQVDETLYDL